MGGVGVKRIRVGKVKKTSEMSENIFKKVAGKNASKKSKIRFDGE